MSTLQVTKIVTVDNNTPLILSTGNAGGGQIIVQSANTDVFFSGNINFSSYVTGDGSGLYFPSSNVANMAFNTANAAFASANNVAPQVTPAYNTANSAFNTANAAFASANNVAPQVTPAFNTANNAYLNSNIAFNTANAAFASANNVAPQVTPSFNTANAAFNTANAAYAAANNITPQIAPSYNTANSAYNTANAAYGYANASNTYAGTTFIKQVAPSQTITGDLAVTGNLTFLGGSATISSNNLIVGDSMIYLAANNYSGTDILDIGFVANYANGTGANVHTGLLRDATTKQYYLFNGLDIELQANNTSFTPGANGVTNAVLNADLYTSNLSLGGANAINWITAAFAKANVPAVNVGQTAPTGAVAGKLWWNSDLGKLFVYYTDPANTSQWVETSPSASAIEAAIITGYINPVYNTVNAAYTSSNSDYVVSNSAFGTVNAAYASINSNWTVTNTTYGVANAAFGKANTALQNTTGTFAGSLNTTGTVTANGYVYVTALDGTGNEGGEIQLAGAGNYTSWSTDAYQNNYRIFARTGSTVSNLNFFHAATGSVRMGINKTDPLYTLDVNGTLNTSSRGITSGSMPSGSILQVQSADLTTYTTTTSTTFVDLGLSVSITPTSSTSKIYIMFSGGTTSQASNGTVLYNLVRNGTNIAQPTTGGVNPATINFWNGNTPAGVNILKAYVDSPATTSAITYKLQWKVDGGTGYFNRHISNVDYNTMATLIVMEIAQ